MEDQVPAFERKYAGKHSNCSCCRGQTSANHLLHRQYIVILVYRKIPPGTLFPHGVVADTAPRLCWMLLTTRVLARLPPEEPQIPLLAVRLAELKSD